MFGSFLPSLWSSSNHSLLGSRSRHCYAIKYRINNSGRTAAARRVLQGCALRPTPNSPIPFRSWLFRKRAKPGSSRDPFGTERMAARRTLRFRPAVQMGSPTGESGVMAGKVVVVTAARLAWEGQPFVLFHILPAVPRGLRSPLSSFSELSFCFF